MTEPALPSFNFQATPWAAQANCRGMKTDEFFPTRGGDVQAIKAVCQSCEVRFPCLEYALDTRQMYGCWGGTSERERRRLRTIRNRNRRATA